MASRNLETFKTLMEQIEGQEPTSETSLKAMLAAVTPDMEFVQPPSLPHGGVHKGREGWRNMATVIRENWEMHTHVDQMLDVPEDDVVVTCVTMDWTAHATGRTVRCPAIHLLRFTDGKISRAEIFIQDTKAVLDTLTDS